MYIQRVMAIALDVYKCIYIYIYIVRMSSKVSGCLCKLSMSFDTGGGDI